MFLPGWRLITLALVALLMGTSFAHVLELPARMQYDGALYVTLQKTLYVMQPARGQLGGLLLRLQQPATLREFQTSLRHPPNRLIGFSMRSAARGA